MVDICLSWSGWDRQRLPSDSAIVLCLGGMPPETTFSAAPDAGRLEILFCAQGGLCLEVPPAQKLELRTGRVLFLPGNTGTCCCKFFSERFRGILVSEEDHSLRSALTTLCPGLPADPPDHPHGCAVVTAALWSKLLFQTLEQLPKHLQGDYCSLKVLELLYLLHAGIPSTAHPAEANYYDPYQVQVVEKIHDYLMEHLDEHLTIPQLAEQFHVSGTMLKACFRERYGAPLHQYFLKRRMERAAELLTTTDQTVIQIASSVGYSSTSQFGVIFKTHYQMSPLQDRQASRSSAGFHLFSDGREN